MLFTIDKIAQSVCHSHDRICAQDLLLYDAYIYMNDFIAIVSTNYDCWIFYNE